MKAEVRRSVPRFPWEWLIPSIVLLAGMAVWGAVVYPELPDEVPRHIGTGGVDAWTPKSFGAAFMIVFVYAGLTVVDAACAAAIVRTVPENELPSGGERWAAALPRAGNRPYSAASALRLARALLVMNALLGVLFLTFCAVLWRTERTASVPGWTMAVDLVLVVVAVAPVFAAALRDRRERRAAA
ncbi:DUF1648 domain-containing protein [Streptomyces armeniacus]|uniref:DUF1648 domain-containing protein n=1 Tax=Streptomyces armeniacus TaxID=83291 RepID=A0A345XTB2_9ACTN|nr:DUF1648 domain-containing protein [Streptomyces armeniacus]AXK34878.1 DUF1648 domain-containing protein [Streptomyces armeniacus]